MEVGLKYSKIKCRNPNWFIRNLKFCKVVFLSPNEMPVVKYKKKLSIILQKWEGGA